MKLSTQEEYGLRCLLQLGRHGSAASLPDRGGAEPHPPVPPPRLRRGESGSAASLTIGELSRMEGISAPNVAKLMRILRRTGFVTSTRGQAGGYVLARPADQIAVGDVLAALGGRFFDQGFCDRHSGVEQLCAHMGNCSIRPVLRQLQNVVDQVLGRLSLRSLLHSEQEMVALTTVHPGSLPAASRTN